MFSLVILILHRGRDRHVECCQDELLLAVSPWKRTGQHGPCVRQCSDDLAGSDYAEQVTKQFPYNTHCSLSTTVHKSGGVEGPTADISR